MIGFARFLLIGLVCVSTAAATFTLPRASAEDAGVTSIETLGEALFFDTNLSRNRTMACATCHSPDAGFTDPRETAAGKAASLGDDGQSIGDRNAPPAAYARFSPAFG